MMVTIATRSSHGSPHPIWVVVVVPLPAFLIVSSTARTKQAPSNAECNDLNKRRVDFVGSFQADWEFPWRGPNKQVCELLFAANRVLQHSRLHPQTILDTFCRQVSLHATPFLNLSAFHIFPIAGNIGPVHSGPIINSCYRGPMAGLDKPNVRSPNLQT